MVVLQHRSHRVLRQTLLRFLRNRCYVLPEIVIVLHRSDGSAKQVTTLASNNTEVDEETKILGPGHHARAS